jgi:hypothetical protein
MRYSTPILAARRRRWWAPVAWTMNRQPFRVHERDAPDIDCVSDLPIAGAI